MSLEASGTTGSDESDAQREAAAARVLVVVMACRDDVGCLARALDSVDVQTDEPADVVVVLPDVAQSCREMAGRRGLRVVTDPGRGLAAAVNTGLGEARPGHQYVTWLGLDDEFLPGALAVAAERLEARPDAVLAYGGCRYVGEGEEYLFTSHDGALSRLRLSWGGDGPMQPAVLARLSAVRAVGGLAEQSSRTADVGLLLRLRRRGAFVGTDRTLAVFHVTRPVDRAELRRVGAESGELCAAALPALLRPVLGPAVRWWGGTFGGFARRARARAQRATGWD
jgi:glycosyltransferase involved in cell wall biosynthesis